MDADFVPEITVFHCVNSFDEDDAEPLIEATAADLTFVNMACSSMVKDVFLLRAFEAGADAVVVLVCPEGHCRYVEGNLRANKRVTWVKNLLDDIGLDGRRLSLFNISGKENDAAAKAVMETLVRLKDLGPSPAK
jgi:coenzyme F420-reducing hydrogenase delta subunit